MKTETFKYVSHKLIPNYLAAGWEDTHALKGTHHSRYSTLMKWPHENSEPVEPQS